MKHSRAPKYIQERREELKHEAQPKRTFGSSLRHAVALLSRGVKTWTGSAIVSVSALLGIASGWVALVPHVSVSQTQPLNVTDPFSTPFIVANEWPFDIYGVHFECYSFSVKTQYSEVGTKLGFVPMDVYYASMKPGERATVPCRFPFTMQDPLQSADIAMIVTFKTAFWPLELHNDFRFQALRAGDKNLYWFPQPLTSPIPDHTRIGGPSSAQGVNKSQ